MSGAEIRLVTSDPGEPGPGRILVRSPWISIDAAIPAKTHLGALSWVGLTS